VALDDRVVWRRLPDQGGEPQWRDVSVLWLAEHDQVAVRVARRAELHPSELMPPAVRTLHL